MTDLDDRLAVNLEQVSVRFRVPHERIPSIKEYAISHLRRRLHYEDFWALRGLDLTVRRNEVLGITGPNGSGKSTLLKVVARVLRPTTGRVRVWGRVAPLLELSAGFDVELTGRENVYLAAATLGFGRRDVDARLGRIIEFAGLGEFIDAPLRTYSSGMMARLGFAVATDVQPDLLLLDEVLSVGDTAFREKSLARIQGFMESGSATLLVSHSHEMLRRLCSRVIVLQQGRIVQSGSPTESFSDDVPV